MTEQAEAYAGPDSLMTPEMARDPQALYRLLQAEPVMAVDGVGVVATVRATVDEVLRQPEIFSSGQAAHDMKTPRPLIPLQIDPPAHRKYRKILDPLFAPQRMRLLDEPVTALVNDLIDAFIAEDEIDFAKQFSIPFPSQVFLTMLGLPLDELPQLLRMKDGMIRPHVLTGEPMGHPVTEALLKDTAETIYAYFENLLASRGDERRDDLISTFLHAVVDGDRLSHEEILDICFLFLMAGLDTVSASLDCFFGYLGRHPEARRYVVEYPDNIPNVVEELLRWETPVMGVARIATRDTEVGGCPVKAGQLVLPIIGAANIDEAEFGDATEPRWDRDANRHLAFGGGIHRCLGSHLARLELRVALREWHRRIPEYEVKAGVELDYSPGIRSVDTFPMVLGPGRN